MSTYQFRQAVREDTPLIIGIAGPTKSGKTYSAHRLAIGLAAGGTIAMINAEGKRGHQYADKFKYVACDLTQPYRPTHYTDALKAAAELNPAVVIIDSASHMHDGPGGLLEWHDEIQKRMAKGDDDKLDKVNFAAWVEPKAAENQFIYTMLGMKCPIVLCFRAKEKIKIQGGKVVDLGWQPIAGERVAFETIFTLMLPPHSKGIPNLDISEMREPFDELVPKGKPIDEVLGTTLLKWSAGAKKSAPVPTPSPAADELASTLKEFQLDGQDDEAKDRRAKLLQEIYGTRSWSAITKLDKTVILDGVAKLRSRFADPKAEQVLAVLAARTALSRPIADEEFADLCEQVLGTRDVVAGDLAMLDELRQLLASYNDGDEISVKTIDRVRKAAA